MANYPPPTRVEHERVQGLRAMLSNAGLSLPPTMTLPGIGGEDRALLRFTRARKDTEKSFAMLKASLEWRRENRVDACLDEPLSDDHARILGTVPGFYVGHSKNGHPVFLDHTAVVPWDKILDTMGMKTFLHAQVQCLEWQSVVVYEEASRRAERPVTQGVNIWDMKGLTISSFTAKVREIAGKSSKIAQDHYPESLAAAYVVNAPTIFSAIWAVVRQFLDAKTVSKVHIMGSGPKMFAKLKEALGEDCYITQDMVCCKKADVGKAERRLGLQSAMAASQTWIRERASMIRAGRVEEAALNSGFSPAACLLSHRSGHVASSPSQNSFRNGLSDSDAEDQFFDAEDDAFSELDDTMFDDDAEELRITPSGDPVSSVAGQIINGGSQLISGGTKIAGAIISAAGTAAGLGSPTRPVHDSLSRAKLIDGNDSPSEDDGGEGCGGARLGADVARHQAEAQKDARAAKRCCGCC